MTQAFQGQKNVTLRSTRRYEGNLENQQCISLSKDRKHAERVREVLKASFGKNKTMAPFTTIFWRRKNRKYSNLQAGTKKWSEKMPNQKR